MIYLIKSAGYGKDNNYIDLLKIGYTEDTKKEGRINASVDPFEKSVIDEVRRGKHDIINNSRKNMIETVGKKKRKLKIATAAIPIAGAIIGAVYGRDNNLKKQRDKIEDAAGDRVADIVRGKKEK